jgi:hypothetical protein
MSGGDDVVVNPESVEQAAQAVSTALGQAAEPGPVPYAAGASPIDAAATAASGQVIALVSAGSGDLAPRGGEVMGVTQDALAGLQSADGQNTTDLQTVGDQAQAQLPVRPGAAASAASAAQGGPASALTGGLGQVEQVLSSGASALGAPASGLGEVSSPASALSGSPLSSLSEPAAQVSQQSGHGEPPAAPAPDDQQPSPQTPPQQSA